MIIFDKKALRQHWKIIFSKHKNDIVNIIYSYFLFHLIDAFIVF